MMRSSLLSKLARSTSSRRSSAAAAAAAVSNQRFLSTNSHNLVLHAVGADRPGIVSDLTLKVMNAGGNVGASQAAKLGPYFSVLMMIDLNSTDKADQLRRDLNELRNIQTSLVVTADPAPLPPTEAIGYRGSLSLKGADHPGIVHKLTKVLSQKNLSLGELTTHEEGAPHGGASLFHLKAVVTAAAPLPKAFDAQIIKEELEDLGNQMNCDIVLKDML